MHNQAKQTNPTDAVHNTVFLRKGPAALYLGMGLTMLDDLCERDPTFPRKIRLSRRCVGFRRADLDSWLELKAKQAAGTAA